MREQSDFNRVNIQLSSSRLPLFQVIIEGNDYPVVFDLGSDQGLSISSEDVEKLDKTYCGIEKWINFKGSKFIYPKYMLPKIQVGSLKFKNVTLTTYPRERENESSVWKTSHEDNTSPKAVGTFGRELLGKINTYRYQSF